MSQRQQQQSAVQHAVRQALSPVSSLRRSSTTYTAGTGELGQSKSSTATSAVANHVCRPQHARGPPLHPSAHFGWPTLAGDKLVHGRALAGGEVPSSRAGCRSPSGHDFSTAAAPCEDLLPPPITAAPLGGEGSPGEALLSTAGLRLLGLRNIMISTQAAGAGQPGPDFCYVT